MALGRRAAALALLAAFLAALIAPCASQNTSPTLEKHHHKHRHRGAEEDVPCSDVAHLGPRDDRCAFVREHCTDTAGLLNYPRLYYCGAARHGALVAGLMMASCVLLLALLFRIIARASDDFFSCILSQISQDLGLPPRLGGVTLLALGNGAPDLSASIEAVKSGDYQLAMGALTGAGMFVGAVVAGRIVTLSGGVRARGAQLRDIATQLITVAVVTGIVASGWFTYGSVIALLSIYVAYVVVVAVADFSKRLGVEWGEVARNVSKRMSRRWRMELMAPLLQADHGSGAADRPAGTLLRSRSTTAAPTPVRSRSPAPGGAGRLAPMPEDEQLPPSAFDKAAAAAPIAAARPPLALGYAGSLPHDIEAAVNTSVAAGAGETPGWLPAGAGAARFASLPDIHSEARLQEQHLQQQPQQQPATYWANRQLRHVPPVAHFQPHMTYGDIVQMSAREYRRRALAEMAQSKSFFERRGGRGQEQERSDSDSDGEEYYSGEEGPAEHWEPAGRHPSPQLQRQQQQGPPPWPSRSGSGGSGSGGSGGYQPPLVQLDSTLLAAREAVAEFEARQAAAAAAGGAEAGGARLGRPSPPPGDARGRRHVAHQESSGSGGSTAQFSVASLEVAPPAGAITPLPAVADEQGPGRQGPLGLLQQAAEAAQWPLVVMLQATIPLVEANSYQRPWFLRSLAASPLFIAAFLQLFTWQALLVALCVGAMLCTLGYLGTLRLEGKAPLWTLGTGYPIGAALLAVYGFGVAAMWISIFASEIVGLLQFFGMLSKAEPAVLGVTVLAWGNSLMDYFNNTAMAGRSRGGNSMAMTACFAGPLFNMLVGLGLGFWALLQEEHARRAAVAMDPVVLVGCLFIMLNCVCLVGVSLAHRQWLPAWCGWAMIAGYCAYLASVLAVLVAY